MLLHGIGEKSLCTYLTYRMVLYVHTTNRH
jgi:hypothetical protein